MTKFTPFKTFVAVVATLASLNVVNAQGWSFLPECGVTCAEAAAVANGCGAQDLVCSCPKQAFLDQTIDCGYDNCPFEDRYPTDYRLRDACENPAGPPPDPSSSIPPPPPSSSTPTPSSSVSAPQSSPPAATTSTTPVPNTSPTRTPTAPGTPTQPSSAPGVASSGFSRSSQSAASTVVVVETVAPDTSGIIEDSAASPLIMAAGMSGYMAAVVVGFMGIGAGLLA